MTRFAAFAMWKHLGMLYNFGTFQGYVQNIKQLFFENDRNRSTESNLNLQVGKFF
jgi:hypothetical protein